MKTRTVSIDTLRGIAAFLVMWSHMAAGEIPQWFISGPMLPIFFFISGYLYKQGESVKTFFKRGVLGLLIPYVIVSYAQAYLNVEDIVAIINDYTVIWEIFVERTVLILRGSSLWFVSALLVIKCICYVLVECTHRMFDERVKDIFLLVLSGIITVVAVLCVEEGTQTIWNVGPAFVNQIFYVLGYVARRKECVYTNTSLKKIFFSGVLYLLVIVFVKVVFGFDGADVRMCQGNLFCYFFVGVSGVWFYFKLCFFVKKIPLITFMGTHSLLYFAFGAHGYILGKELLELISIQTWNMYIYTFIVSVIAGIAWVIPAIIIDKVCPILNGKMELGIWGDLIKYKKERNV